jgi:hypothetical protein
VGSSRTPLPVDSPHGTILGSTSTLGIAPHSMRSIARVLHMALPFGHQRRPYPGDDRKVSQGGNAMTRHPRSLLARFYGPLALIAPLLLVILITA